VAVVSGMGTELAGAAAERLLDAEDVALVVVVGISGGVEDQTPIGTVIRPALVIDAATGTEHRPVAIGGPRRGALWTTDVLTPAAELPGLRARGVVGLDMETAAVAAVCEQRGVGWTSFRALSDRPADHIDDEVLAMSNQDGTPNLRQVVRYVSRHPARVPALARMGRRVKVATERATFAALAAWVVLDQP
jgi:adenosylhomocysteine nucleosidase